MRLPPLHRDRRCNLVYASMLVAVLTSGCTSNPPNANGHAAIDIDPGLKGPVSGVGIEGRDIVSMTDQMMRDLLSTPEISDRSPPPRIIVDAEYFVNDGVQAINKNTITDRLRVNLNRAARSRMVFVGRGYSHMVEHERELKRAGTTDVGTTGMTKAQLGADYRLGGRITSLDSRSGKTGMTQRYSQITFEMIDLESGAIAWSGMYEFARAGADDVVYR